MFRGRSLGTLALEGLAIVVLLAAAGTAVYLHSKRQPVHVERPLAGREQNVSRDGRVQYAPALAVDPRRPKVLLGGSSDSFMDTRVYVSTNGGWRWSSTPGPPFQRANCDVDQPAVAVAGNRQLYAFGVSIYCDPIAPHVHVAVRKGVGGRWHVRAVAPVRGYVRDDRFAFATHGSQVWLAWARRPQRYASTLVGYLAASPDAGTSWPHVRRLPVSQPYSLAIVASTRGLYVLTATDDNAIVALRSRDGGRTFDRRATVARLATRYDPTCEGAYLPPQSRACVGPSVHAVADDAGNVLVGWDDVAPNGTAVVELARLSSDLRALTPPQRIGPPDRQPADQFDLSLAIDASDGAVWACYLDTLGDPYRHQAWTTCTASRNGGRTWAAPRRVAVVSSDETQTAANFYGYGSTAVVAANGFATVMWTDTRRLLAVGEEIYAARVPERAFPR